MLLEYMEPLEVPNMFKIPKTFGLALYLWTPPITLLSIYINQIVYCSLYVLFAT